MMSTFLRSLTVLLLLFGPIGIAPTTALSDGRAPSMLQQVHTLAFPVAYKNYIETGNTWNSTLSLRNLGTGVATVQITFDGGFPRNYTLAAGASRHIPLTGLGTALPDGRYAALVASNQPLAGTAWMRVQAASVESHGMALGVDGDSATLMAYLPSVASVEDAAGMISSLHVQNLSGAPLATVIIDFYDTSGNLVRHEVRTGIATALHLNLADIGALLPTYTGSAVVSASGNIAVVYSQFRETWYTAVIPTLHVANGVPSGARNLYAPALFDSLYGITSALTVQNATDQPAHVTVAYSDGLPQNQVNLNPHASYTFVYNQGAHTEPFGAAISADRDVVAVAGNRNSASGVTFEAAAEPAMGQILPVAVRGYGNNFNSRVTLFNPGLGDAQALVTFEGYANHPVTALIFPGEATRLWLAASTFDFLPAGWIGSVSVVADKPIFALGSVQSNSVTGDGWAEYRGVPTAGVSLSPTIDKTANVEYVKPGDVVTYTLSFDVANVAAGGTVVVTDVLPSEVTLIGTQYGAGQTTTALGNGVWEVEILPNQHGLITLQAQVTTTVAADVAFVNTATVADSYGTAEDSVAVILDVTPPNTSITSAPPNPDNDSTPTFEFAGSDDAGSGVASFECRVDGGSWSACASPHTLARLTAGTHTFSARAIDNVGYVDTTPAARTWEFVPEPLLDIDKRVDAGGLDPVPLGSVVTYTIVISNSGDALADNVVMTDVLPSAVTFGSWISYGGTVILPPGTILLPPPGSLFLPSTVVWAPGDLPAGGVVTLTFTALVTTTADFAGATVVNTADVVADNASPASDSVSFVIESGEVVYRIFLPLVLRNAP